jgi:type I restriction enzyme S subunit
MAGEWKETSLREAGVTLIDCDHRTPPAADSGYPYIAIPQLKEGRLALNDVRRISPEHFTEWTRKAKPQHHDVILSRRCNPGQTAYVPAGLDCALGQNLVLLRADGSKLYPPFLRWLVRGPDWWEQIGTFINVGAVFDSLKCADIPNFSMPLPPLAEQKAIAAVLGALDDKIELNRRMNATLEAMARALFQSWFVDFDPVRAKLDGRQPVGMDSTTAALFPEHLEDSPLGHIPKGWRACTLGDIAKNVSITFDFKRTPEVVFINTGDVLEGDLLHSNRSLHVGLPGQAKKSIRSDDILFSEIRPANKRYAYVDFDSSDYVVSTKFMIIRGSKEIHPRLLYRIFTAKETLDEFQVQAESRSGTFPQITFDSISHLPIVLPPIEIQEAFQRAVGKMDAQIKVNKQQSRTLSTLRDTLLPKLLSGELSGAGGNSPEFPDSSNQRRQKQ